MDKQSSRVNCHKFNRPCFDVIYLKTVSSSNIYGFFKHTFSEYFRGIRIDKHPSEAKGRRLWIRGVNTSHKWIRVSEAVGRGSVGKQ